MFYSHQTILDKGIAGEIFLSELMPCYTEISIG